MIFSTFGRHLIRCRFPNNFFIKSGNHSLMSCVQPLVICGPSGSGKSTLLNKLMDEFSDCFTFSISRLFYRQKKNKFKWFVSSDTTRSPRSGETNGKEYHFVDKQTFERMIAQNMFVEFTQFSGNYYGTRWTHLSLNSTLIDNCLAKFWRLIWSPQFGTNTSTGRRTQRSQEFEGNQIQREIRFHKTSEFWVFSKEFNIFSSIHWCLYRKDI